MKIAITKLRSNILQTLQVRFTDERARESNRDAEVTGMVEVDEVILKELGYV